MTTPENLNNILAILSIYLGIVFIVFWAALVIWTYRDMRARSRDNFAQLLSALLVALLNIPGVLAYLLLRPRETLSEAYERSLEEEALLQEIETKPTCPGCGQIVKSDWQICAYCHTTLKRPCVKCSRQLDLSWTICPYCTTPQKTEYLDNQYPTTSQRNAGRTWTRTNNPAQQATSQAGSLEFIEDEEV